MLCLRCARGALYAPLRQVQRLAVPVQQRSFGFLTSISRPTTFARPLETAPSAHQPTSNTSLSLLQVRGAKRDTYNPSHVVRKRRHGFLSRLRTRTGRMILKRRRQKKRNTLSH